VRDDELVTRWVQLGVFSHIFRLHSLLSRWTSKEPWLYRQLRASCGKYPVDLVDVNRPPLRQVTDGRTENKDDRQIKLPWLYDMAYLGCHMHPSITFYLCEYSMPSKSNRSTTHRQAPLYLTPTLFGVHYQEPRSAKQYRGSRSLRTGRSLKITTYKDQTNWRRQPKTAPTVANPILQGDRTRVRPRDSKRTGDRTVHV
jgi:hypothetical protein